MEFVVSILSFVAWLAAILLGVFVLVSVILITWEFFTEGKKRMDATARANEARELQPLLPPARTGRARTSAPRKKKPAKVPVPSVVGSFKRRKRRFH